MEKSEKTEKKPANKKQPKREKTGKNEVPRVGPSIPTESPALTASSAPPTPNANPGNMPDTEAAIIETSVKEMEKAFFAIRFYPVASDRGAKDAAIEKLVDIYSKGSETMRQLLLYTIHEQLSGSIEFRVMHNYEYFKSKTPNVDQTQLRMNVYRSMFNHGTSLEGLTEMIRFLGRCHGNDDAAKLLTHHFSHLSTYESEANQILRAAILEALGASESPYALRTLLDYARYTDNERTFHRILISLFEWEKKLDSAKIPEKERKELLTKLREVVTSEFTEDHYR